MVCLYIVDPHLHSQLIDAMDHITWSLVRNWLVHETKKKSAPTKNPWDVEKNGTYENHLCNKYVSQKVKKRNTQLLICVSKVLLVHECFEGLPRSKLVIKKIHLWPPPSLSTLVWGSSSFIEKIHVISPTPNVMDNLIINLEACPSSLGISTTENSSQTHHVGWVETNPFQIFKLFPTSFWSFEVGEATASSR